MVVFMFGGMHRIVSSFGLVCLLLCALALPGRTQPEISFDTSLQTIAELRDQDPKVRIKAARALQWSQQAVPALIEALQDEEPTVRAAVAGALGWRNNRQAVPALSQALTDPAAPVRVSALVSLSRICDPRGVDGMLLALRDEDATVRVTAVRAFHEVFVIGNWAPLPDGPLEPDAPAMVRARELLQWERIREALAQALTDGVIRVRANAAAVLIRFEDERGLAVVLDALRSEDRVIRREALQALNRSAEITKIFPQIVPLVCEELQKETVAAYRVDLLRLLGQLQDKRAVDPIIEVLDDRNLQVRTQAVTSLGLLRDARAVTAILPLLQDTNSRVRVATVTALGQLQAKEAVPSLVLLLKDREADVQRSAATVLGTLGDHRAVESLITALPDLFPTARPAAITSLRALTGQLLSEDIAEWQEWWAKQGE